MSTHLADAFALVLRRSEFWRKQNVLPSQNCRPNNMVCIQSVELYMEDGSVKLREQRFYSRNIRRTITIQFSCYWQVERWLLLQKLHILIRFVVLFMGENLFEKYALILWNFWNFITIRWSINRLAYMIIEFKPFKISAPVLLDDKLIMFGHFGIFDDQ